MELVGYDSLGVVSELNHPGRGRWGIIQPRKGLQGRSRVRLGFHGQPKVTLHRVGIGSQVRPRAPGQLAKDTIQRHRLGGQHLPCGLPVAGPIKRKVHRPLKIASSGLGLIAQGLNGKLPRRQGMAGARLK
ncbi:hypothetical protein [Phenylobacterium parvum]|uniref:hypothetical protein n=1 Tax=Phenylobacterium parvum TaxID=2201350 RepID=UPI0013A55C5B|nr:hypothetical protein [Phenylobacterium parvum]